VKDPRLRELVEEATAGLKDDPELRLDVQQELASHIETAAEEYQASGRDEEESWNAALKDFGGPVDLAQSLVEGNRRRMKLRGSLRLAIRALVMPAALVSALWISFEGLQSWSFLLPAFLSVSSLPYPFKSIHPQLTRAPLKKEEKLLLWGDRTRDTRSEQQHAIVELERGNAVYYGNYMSCLLAERRWDRDGHLEEKASLVAATQEGARLDPNNARYDYIAAFLLLEEACKETRINDEDADDASAPWRLEIYDRQAVDQGMARFLQGSHKPFCKSYMSELLAMRLSILPPSQDLGEMWSRIELASEALLPFLSDYRHLARISIRYGERLLEEGHPEEAQPFLISWLTLSRQMTEASSTWIEELVVFSILEIGRDEAVPLLKIAGQEQYAEEISSVVQEMLQPWEEQKSKGEKDKEMVRKLMKSKGSILDAMLLPALHLGKDDFNLETGRLLDQTILERMGLLFFNALFLLLLVLTCLAAIRWRRAPGAGAAPLLLLPKGRELLFTLVFSVVAPLGLFFIYTRWSGLAGREYSVVEGLPRFVAELFLLSEVIFFLAVRRSMRQVRERCETLEVGCPKKLKSWQIALLLLLPVAWFTWLLRGPREVGTYKGTLARSLIPVLCLVLLLTGLVCHPYLHRRERDLIQSSHYLYVMDDQDPPVIGFTRPEAELVVRLKREVLEAAARHPSVFEKDG